MIKPTELRIGNFIKNNGLEGQVAAISNRGTRFGAHSVCYDFKHFEPILISEEWLQKLGFNGHEPYFINDFGIMSDGTAWTVALRMVKDEWPDYGNRTTSFYELPHQIQYVHELQNLYFALTGEELTPSE